MSLPSDHVLTALTETNTHWDAMAFIGSLNIGGCERHLAMVYPRLAATGLKVAIVTFQRGGPLEAQVRAGGVDVFCIDRDRSGQVGRNGGRFSSYMALALILFDIRKLLRSGRVGIAHFFLPGAYILGGIAAVLARHSNSVMSRRSLNNYQAGHPIATCLERFLHRRMRVVTANASPAAAQLLDEGAPPERTLVLHNGVDTELADHAPDRTTARNAFGLEPDDLAIAIVANLIPYKGHGDLIEALRQIKPRLNRKWTLLIAGRDDGPGRALRERAEQFGIVQNIRWLGLIDNVPTLWRAADIGVLASHQEGLPNSLLEAMSMGTPTVTTNVGGVADIVTDGVDALVVPPRDSEAMAGALLRLVESADLRKQVGAAAAVRIRSAFSLDACVDSYSRLYKMMLHQPTLSSAEIVRQFQPEMLKHMTIANL
jgi:glycosyltransferase involved in cell wall biosynthesis